MPDAEQQELLLAFVEEGNELLDESEPLLIELESRANESGEVDYEVLNTIFRLFHSLKGGAGFLDLNTVQKVTHEAETLLDLFRKGKGQIQSDHIDLLTRTCDFLRQLLENIETDFTDEGFEEEGKDLISGLRYKIVGITGEEIEEEEDLEEVDEEENANGNQAEAQEESAGESEEAKSDGDKKEIPPELQLTITPEMIKQFVAESEDLLAATEESFLILDKEPGNEEHIGSAFRSLHSFKGNAGFLGYSDLERLSHQAETVLDKIRTKEIAGSSDLFSLLLDVLDFLREGVLQVGEGKEPTIPAAPGMINLLKDNLEKARKSKKKKKKAKAAAPPAVAAAPPQEKPVAPPEKPAAPAKSAAKTPAKSGGNQKAAQRQSIRVDIEKLEVLLDLVGELVIAEAMVAQNPDLQGLDVSLESFEKASLHLNKITRDLQDIATSIRMIPLSSTFRRMIRLVRDLAQKTGKKVELEIIGEETEVDKTVIEQITDPLVHIIRNSIDHGLTVPEARREKGKPDTGKLILEAKYVGGEVWILVKDDGQGLNRNAILKKASDKGLVDGDGSDLPDESVWQLIFHPGFSTAAKITDVSGRGVGMDVVKRNIENIRGKVDIASIPGRGTEVVLRIPLTLAIIDGMIIRVGENRYIIPIISIKETLRPNYKDITQTMDGQEILNVRGQLLPTVRLHEFYNVEPSFTELTDGIIMIVENAGKRFCLFVDELIGQQQVVIKGLSEYIGDVKAISGCTILGDGTVCLIIDVAGLTEAASAGAVQGQSVVSDPIVEV